MTSPDKIKDKFDGELHSVIATIPKADKLIILGDFKARVGSESISWEEAVGKHGAGNSNSTGPLLLRTCAEHGLLITNTVLCLPARNKTPWMHPRSKHWYLMDCHRQGEGQAGCMVDKGHVWRRVLDRPSSRCLQAQHPRPTQETPSEHEDSKTPGVHISGRSEGGSSLGIPPQRSVQH
ncbi:hypothetical protein ACOMHN_043704 [Nucella lapillus]